jgi:cytochrome c oxidase subunit 2
MRLTGRYRFLALATAVFLALVFSIGSASAQVGPPRGATNEARDIHDLYWFITALALVVFVVVEAGLIWAIIRYRRRDDTLPNQVHGSTVIEIIWTVIPIILVAAIFVSSFVVLRRIENRADEQDLTIEVLGFQWQWGFTYNLDDLGRGEPRGEGRVTILGTPAQHPTLLIPAGEPVEFKLHSNDVIHSFYVREFNYKLDVIPGRDNRFVVTARPQDIGKEIEGRCAEFCGLEHAFMTFTLRVVSREEFDRWIDDQAARVRLPQ